MAYGPGGREAALSLFAEVEGKLPEQNKAAPMQTTTPAARHGTEAAPAGDREVLNQIHALSVESVELLRSLVQMLLPRAEPRDGPSLEELLAALLASQRDQTVMLRQIGADIAALHAKLPKGDADKDPDSPPARPNGRHHS